MRINFSWVSVFDPSVSFDSAQEDIFPKGKIGVAIIIYDFRLFYEYLQI